MLEFIHMHVRTKNADLRCRLGVQMILILTKRAQRLLSTKSCQLGNRKHVHMHVGDPQNRLFANLKR